MAVALAGHQFPGVHAPLHTGDGSAYELPYCPAGHGTQLLLAATLYCPGPHTATVGDVEPTRQ